MYRVIIIEDDPMVAAINRQYVETDQTFSVVGVFKHGAEALAYLAENTVDLIILDYYTPVMTGLEFVDQLHRMEKTPSIIMVTSANDTSLVERLLSRGILDYLVKPFEYKRFQQAMDKFLQTKKLLEGGHSNLDQQLIDKLTLYQEAPRGGQKPQLAKGLNAATLDLIRSFLIKNKEQTYTSEQIADQVKLSRITVRRYVNYLVEIDEVASAIDYQTGGRPSIHYHYVGLPGPICSVYNTSKSN